jgi:hypothetical protein
MIDPSCHRRAPITSRRELLQRAGLGCGMLALAGLFGDEARGDDAPATGLHVPPKAKNVIWLFMEGAPSSVDLFDPKPELDKRAGQKMEIDTFNGSPGPLMKSPFKFKQYGESGAWVCEKYTSVAKHVDDFAFLKGLYTGPSDHVPALYQINTGIARPGFPAAGSWITYGLGTENQNLPGYVVLGNKDGVKGGPLNWGAGFLPSSYQGTLFRSEGNPIINLKRPQGVDDADQRAQLDLLAKLNGEHLKEHEGEADLAARIQSFELAYRMQMEAVDLVDFSTESKETRAMYGVDNPTTKSFGSKCLMARRLVEKGVRFVQVYSDGEWDAHSDLAGNHSGHCAATDVPIDGLLTDLKARGLWESTLVIWGGEFGRMPVTQGTNGRDHNPNGFMAWLAGAGIKGGTSYGETDEVGFKAVVDRTSVHDLHATMLHLLGVDHKRLTHFHNGRNYRLTDVAGNVIEKILS